MKNKRVDNSCPTPKGILVIIGGKEDRGTDDKEKDSTMQPLEVLDQFVKLIGKENPLIELITSASTVSDELFQEYTEAFDKLGVKQVNKLHHTERQQVLSDDLSERLQAADGFFFTGGDQLLLTSLYGGTDFLTILKQRYISEEIVIGGTSAGAMALSTPMIYAGNKYVQQIAGSIKVTTGLEFLKDVCIDTHFIDRSRMIRMAQVIATNPTAVGIGIEEDTAIVLRNGNDATVIGTGLITIVEGFEITNTNIIDFDNDTPISIRNLRVHLLGRDQQFTIPQMNPPHL